MTKKLFIVLLFIGNLLFINAQTKAIVVEKNGLIDMKYNETEWREPFLKSEIPVETDIITGFHSNLSLKIGENSYITINQLSKIKLLEINDSTDDINTRIKLDWGYIVIFSKPENERKKNKIIIEINRSTVEFDNSGGEIFLRKDTGAVIKSFSGKINIGSRLSKKYSIKKDEVCGILPSDVLIESDYFLRRQINIKPNKIIEESKILAYYDMLFIPYTNEKFRTDYSSQFNP